jgi:ribosomal protein L37AE/L43A
LEEKMERINYECGSCGYKFTRKAEAKIVRCPYCSKEGTVDLVKGNYASKILGEVTGE